MQSVRDALVLNNGVKIPCVGFGTWQAEDDEAYNSVLAAIKAGYTHIDTAAIYGNEVSVGKAIAKAISLGLVKRQDLFITSKVWNDDRGYETTLKAFEESLKRLGLDYLDLYLIHWPAPTSRFDNWDEINLATWKAMTELYKAGKIKAIGVSNFREHHLKSLLATEVKPMVNQIEFHPGQMQKDLVEFCKANNILVEAWGPMGTGRLLKNELLADMGKKYGKSVAQICIKWCVQNGTLPLPKSVNEERIIANADIFDFEISKEDMATINNMPYAGGSGHDPDTVPF